MRHLLSAIVSGCLCLPVMAAADAHATLLINPLGDLRPDAPRLIGGDGLIQIPPGAFDRSVLHAPRGVIFDDRRAPRTVLIWKDSTDAETGYRIERYSIETAYTPPTINDWETVRVIGPQDGFVETVDLAAQPDTITCYRVVAIDSTEEKLSAASCANLVRRRTATLTRLELDLSTADIDNAGTDDLVEVRLGYRAVVLPNGNHTYLDYSHNDFQRGSTHTYHLRTDALRYVTDPVTLDIEKPGSDDLCLTELALRTNGETVFEKSFAGEPDGCVWLNDDNGGRLSIPFEELRASPTWGASSVLGIFTQDTIDLLTSGSLGTPVTNDSGLIVAHDLEINLSSEALGLTGALLQGSIEGSLGDALQRADGSWWIEAEWGQPVAGTDSAVALQRLSDEALRFVIRLNGDIPAFFDAGLDISFDLRVALDCADGAAVDLDIGIENLDLDADFAIWWLENNIESKFDAIPLGVSNEQLIQLGAIGADGRTVTCIDAGATIDDDGTISLGFVLRQSLQTVLVEGDSAGTVVEDNN